MAEKGSISIHAQNLMPVIKKWMYSDKDIFLREIVSNGCDAIAKYKVLCSKGESTAEDKYEVTVTANPEAGTLTVADNGIGMTADEVKKYIAQVAFSGAEEFLKQYKPEDGAGSGIIGHFGLGFYSSFMVSGKVVIDTLSYREGAEAVRWSSEDGMEYEMEPSDRATHGTTITMYLTEDNREFLEMWTLRSTLNKYCQFMPTPIFVQEIKPVEEPKDGEDAQPTPMPEQVNNPSPLWMKRPNECTDEEYRDFYHEVFHDTEEPLFWIHLNAEFPFNLKGILYFPKIKNEFSASEGTIKLYNNQVFVADNIKEVIPEFLMLLKGCIDCPDLPLNVSRSFLQNDGYVKKMASYITRKVADRLVSEFNTKRSDYQKYWDDIHPFVKYGCIRDEKFYGRVKSALLFKTTAGEYLTVEEYANQFLSDDDKTIYYTTDEKRQAQMIEMFTSEGKGVVILPTLIDTNFISFLEYAEKDNKYTFKRVDAGMDGLTENKVTNETDRLALEETFKAALDDSDLEIALASFKSDDMPAMITVDEQMRRYADMSRHWGENFAMPQKRTLTLNDKHPLVRFLATSADADMKDLVCKQVLDLAEMARQPLEAERMVEFIKRSNHLLTKMIDK